jgi:hypothetical protein
MAFIEMCPGPIAGYDEILAPSLNTATILPMKTYM